MNAIPDVVDENEYARLLAEHLNRLFGNKKSLQDNVFNNELLAKGKLGPSVLLNFFIVCWIAFAYASVDQLVFYKQRSLKRCEIDVLENYFSHEQIVAIITEESQSLTSTCHYMDRNYTELLILSNYSYINMMTNTRRLKPTRKIPCKKFKSFTFGGPESNITGEGVSFYDYYDLHCTAYIFKEYFELWPFVGQALFYVPLGIMSDLYGRMFVFVQWSIVLVLATCLCFVPNVWCGLVARVFLGTTDFPVMIYLVIFIETSSLVSRKYLGFLLFAAEPLAVLFMQNRLNLFYVYYMRLFVALSFFLPCAFILWSRRESARWMYYRGKKVQAWKAIVPVSKLPASVFEMSHSLHKVSLCKHMSLFGKVIFRLRTLRALAIVFNGTFISAHHDSRRINAYESVIERYLSIAFSSLLVLILIFHIILMFVARRNALILAFSILVATSSIGMVQQTNSSFLHACGIVEKALSHACTYVIFYQVIELYPTPQRGTILGMCLSTMGLSYTVVFHLNYYFSDKRMSLALIVLALTIMSLLLVAFIPNTFDRDLPDVPREALSEKIINVC